MQLTSYTDYSLRVLLYLANNTDRLVTIAEVSDFHSVSRNHMVKVVHNLGRHGFVKTVRGKSGGMKLGKPPADIRLSDVLAVAEPHMNIQECFDRERNTCPIVDDCKLMGVLHKARQGFMAPFENTHLADIL